MRDNESKDRVGIAGYIWFIFAFCFFSGIFRNAPGALKLLDLNTYLGKFGTIVEGATAGFVGKGGTGLNNLFATVLTIAPGVMFCLAVMEAVEYYGGLRAAGKIFNPILKPLMGVPGESSLVLISNLQSSDSSAALIKSLYDNKRINKKQREILTAYIMPGPALLGMMISYGVILAAYTNVSTGIIIVIVLAMKVVVSELMRFVFTSERKNGNAKKEEV